MKVEAGSALKIEFSGRHTPHLLRIFAVDKPGSVILDGKTLPEGDAWRFEAEARRIIIKTRDYAQGTYVISGRRWPPAP